MFYRITPSLDPTVIGDVALQFERPVRAVLDDVANGYRQHFLKRARDPLSVITPTPVLMPNAKLTDLLNGSGAGSAGQLVISEKLKGILESAKNPGIQFFPMTVVNQKVELPGYWLTNSYAWDLDSIDFEASAVELRTASGIRKVKDLTIHDYNEFKQAAASQGTGLLHITKLAIKPNIQCHLLALTHVSGGIGYYVSQALMELILDADCTGIEFQPLGK